MKKKISDLQEKEIMQTLDLLYTAAGVLKDREAAKRFLKDLLTVSERIMIGRRIMIARLLLAGTSHADIVEKLGVGYDTIAKVRKWLDDEIPGYEDVCEKMEKVFEKRKDVALQRKMYVSMKRKYPLHFLFFPWPEGYSAKKLRTQ